METATDATSTATATTTRSSFSFMIAMQKRQIEICLHSPLLLSGETLITFSVCERLGQGLQKESSRVG